MSKLFVDDIVEKTSNHGVVIPGNIIQIVQATSTTGLQMSSNNASVDTGLTGSIRPLRQAVKF